MSHPCGSTPLTPAPDDMSAGDHVAEERAFAGSGHAKDRDVLAAGVRRDSDDLILGVIPLLIFGAEGRCSSMAGTISEF